MKFINATLVGCALLLLTASSGCAQRDSLRIKFDSDMEVITFHGTVHTSAPAYILVDGETCWIQDSCFAHFANAREILTFPAPCAVYLPGVDTIYFLLDRINHNQHQTTYYEPLKNKCAN
jgi:hypothetical protein